jgi:hypothetical protein
MCSRAANWLSSAGASRLWFLFCLHNPCLACLTSPFAPLPLPRPPVYSPNLQPHPTPPPSSTPPTPSACCSEEALAVMQVAPMRGFDPAIHQEPHVYRMLEASSLHAVPTMPALILRSISSRSCIR